MKSLLERARRHGIANTLHQLALKVLDKVAGLQVLRGVWVETPDPAFLDVPEGYKAGFVGPAALREFAADPVTEIGQRFLQEAAMRGDACYGFTQGKELAAYGWYGDGPTPISADLMLHFDRRYVYMYKGFTDLRHRGKRLHALGMTRALRFYRASGFRGIVSYVEASNLDSLKSCYRMGYQVFGSLYTLKLFGHWYCFSSRGCKRFSFRAVPRGSRANGLQSGLLPNTP